MCYDVADDVSDNDDCSELKPYGEPPWKFVQNALGASADKALTSITVKAFNAFKENIESARLAELAKGHEFWHSEYGDIPTNQPLTSTTLNELFYGKKKCLAFVVILFHSAPCVVFVWWFVPQLLRNCTKSVVLFFYFWAHLYHCCLVPPWRLY
jgi:hypothetical protein